ncbi:MAG: N-acetyltransferase [Caldisericia bacterium]|jgi:ribosomal protein S18 acetylase RimI-like enzyme|nr:N-acetyltransferase [Caldisericia bacterium]
MEILIIKNGDIKYKEDFANLIIYTGKDLFYTIFGDKAKEILKQLYTLKNNQFSYELTNFAIYNNKIAGMVLSYSYDDLMKTSLNTGLLLIKIMKFDFFINLIKFIKSFTKLSIVNKDEYYISNIAVYPEFRGLGIGKSLLFYTERLAKDKNLKKLSLDVERENISAIEIYKKFGFKIVKEFEINFSNKKFYFYKMEKSL